MRALIVDDQEDVRTITDIILKDVGFGETIQAANGGEALAFLKNHSVDLIISDWAMPGMDGLELVNVCKKDPVLKNIPFVMSSGQSERSEMLRALDAGVDAYVVKPFSFNELQNTLEKVRLQASRE